MIDVARKRTRKQVRDLRFATIWGLVGGVAFFLLVRLTAGRSIDQYSLFFGSMTGWPMWLRNCWALDLVFTLAYAWVLAFLGTKIDPGAEKIESKPWRVVVGCGLGVGSVISLPLTVGGGWFKGLEAFIVICGGFCVVGMLIVLCAWVSKEGSQTIKARHAVRQAIKITRETAPRPPRRTWIAWVIVLVTVPPRWIRAQCRKVRSWAKAEDVPEPAPNTDRIPQE
ncbi:MAG TPA: hypothetical protein VLF91_02460 [Candidatus Saccharimonadales bacterium]|nr:hypothetical protein [Candidatus Saccharimonadales bacterium]